MRVIGAVLRRNPDLNGIRIHAYYETTSRRGIFIFVCILQKIDRLFAPQTYKHLFFHIRMPDLQEYPASPETLEKAVSKLEGLSISDGKKAKIRNLLENSRFSGVYSEYFLAEDPQAFKTSLDHNRQFARDCEQYGLDTKVLQEGLPDAGIDIKLDPGYVGDNWQKLANYSTEFFGIITDAVKIEKEKLLQYTNEGIVELSDKLSDLQANVKSLIENRDSQDIVESYLRSVTDELVPAVVSAVRYSSEFIQQIKSTIMADVNRVDTPESEEDQEECYANLVESIQKLCADESNKFEIFKDYETMTGLSSQMSQEVFIQLYNLYTGTGKIQSNHLQELAGNGYDYCASLRELCVTVQDDVEFASEQRRRLDNLEPHLGAIMNLLDGHSSTRLKNIATSRYFVQLESLPPEDITFGNDGGCCIAVGENDLGSGDSVPFFQLDDATLVFGIYHQVRQRKPKRVGIVLSFASVDADSDPALLVNSIELSGSMNPLNESGFQQLVTHVTEYLHTFNDAAGFKRQAMGHHNYNTGKNYMDPDSLLVPDYEQEELMKLPDKDDVPSFYSEVLTDDHYSQVDTWSFVMED